MPDIRRQYSLKHLNTFHLDVTAACFAECRSVPEIQSLIREAAFRSGPGLIIGEGSNILFSGDFTGFVLRPSIMGKEIISEDRESVIVQAGAGENWDAFVEWAVNWGFGGIENLSLIPGSVGSSPIQNIGAYGMEVSKSIERVLSLDRETGQKLVFENESCRFGYRDSIFKREWKDRCIITSVIFRLSKQPRLNLGYQGLAGILEESPTKDVRAVRKAVIEIRRSKLPDPEILGNAGSFFKNPAIPSEHYEALKKQFPGMPSYPAPGGHRKIPAAWMIEQCGWKGRMHGPAGTYEHQPLVIVNHGGASGKEILELAGLITEDVENKFGIRLVPEVNIL
jgi:UDP-N-acetylmuramate dehydrogenase